MHFTKLALAAAAAGSAMGASESICDKYTTALLKQNTGANQLTLLTLLVNTAVIGNFTGPGTKQSSLPGSKVNVPGILSTKASYMGMPVNLLQYFDGSLVSTNQNGMPSATNWLDGGGAAPIEADPTSSGTKGSNQYTLLTHLYSYFGALLGCSQLGMSGFPAYAGSNSMFNVHRYMDLSATEFTYFVEQVGLAAASFGVTMADIDTAAMALNSTFGMKCSPAATVVPNTPKELQAICVGSGCPTATSGAVCSSYPAETMAASATMMSSSMASGMSSSMSGSMMSSSGAMASSTAAAGSSSAISKAGAVATAIPAAAAGIAGIVALAL